jgi:hypothetical protein
MICQEGLTQKGFFFSPGCTRVEQEALALGADAFFQKPVSFQRFMALGDLIKAVVFGHTQA